MTAPRIKPPLEKVVQRAVMQLFRAAGWTVRSLSQYRASHVAVGVPDLMMHHPRRGLFCWFEVKAPRPQGYDPRSRQNVPRTLAPDQLLFRMDAVACGQRHYWGGLAEAEAALIEMGCATRAPNGGLLLRGRQEVAA